MDSEEAIINNIVADIVNTGLKNKRRICSIGTSTCERLKHQFRLMEH